jgi:hypothetical protein
MEESKQIVLRAGSVGSEASAAGIESFLYAALSETSRCSPPTSIRAIRGLPLGEGRPPSIQAEPAAYRDHLCASGPCVDKGVEQRRYVGFRCARAAAP